MVGWEFPPHHTGGLGVHVYELTRELTHLGHQVTFLTPFHGPFTEVPGVTFRWPGEPPNWPGGHVPFAYAGPNDPGAAGVPAMVDYNSWVADAATQSL